MTNIRFRKSLAILAVAIVPVLSLTASPVEAKSKGSIEKMENALSAAGFVARPANTPARQAMLSRLPADKFARKVKDDKVLYVYADPKVCGCIYVGDQQAYGTFQRDAAAKKLADEQLWAAQDYNDPAWSWGAWGPWGGRYARFGFGHWRGW